MLGQVYQFAHALSSAVPGSRTPRLSRTTKAMIDNTRQRGHNGRGTEALYCNTIADEQASAGTE